MKTTTTSHSDSGLENRPEQSRTDNRTRINFEIRKVNRSRDTVSLLELLRNDAPEFYAIAEVVGKWVWIQFEDRQPPTVTSVLSELGFHWNKTRQAWQHPCGVFCAVGATVDPRQRYPRYSPATGHRA